MSGPDCLNPSPRERIAAALYALVDAAAGSVVTLITSSRVLRHFDQVDVTEMPALFQTQIPESYERPGQGLPPKRTMHFELWLYTSDGQSPTDVPSSGLNMIVDAVEFALQAPPLTNVLTLGGICAHCWIEGSVGYFEGLSHDGKSIAIIPIAVLMP